MSLVMEILDRHVELAMWADHQDAVVFWDAYLQSQEEEWKHARRANSTKKFEHIVKGYAASVGHMMGLAETYYVSPDLCGVIEEACMTVPREPLRAHMIPSRIGWIEFGQTIILGVDDHDEPWGIAGVSWRIEDDESDDRYDERYGGSRGIQWFDADGGKHIGPGITIVWWRNISESGELGHIDISWVKALPWAAPGQLTGWTFNIPWDPEDRGDHFTLDDNGDIQRKILLTTFNLLMDELVVVRQERPNRAALRRASRALKSPEFGDVNVVDLRKLHVLNYEPPEPDDDAEPVHWTHRWIVRGHWRTIHRGTSKERHIWIRKHVKGPDNRPIIVKDRLSRLIR